MVTGDTKFLFECWAQQMSEAFFNTLISQLG